MKRMACDLFVPWLLMCAASAAGEEAAPPAPTPGPVRLILPTTLDAVPGIETNLYLENLILAVNPANYALDVTCEKGRQLSERWTYEPKPEEVGSYPLRVDVIDEANQVVASASTTLRVTPADAGAGRAVTLLCIGDSLTHASVYTQHLLDLFAQPGSPALTLVGTNGPGNEPGVNRHEGYGGWTAKYFMEHFTGSARGGEFAKRGSPFLYAGDDGTPRYDFARYCADVNGGKAPDFVTVLLGANDTAWANDANLEGLLDEMLANLDKMVAGIRAFGPETRIGLVTMLPPAASQDAFGAAYHCKIKRWQYLRNQHRAVERLYERFGGREAENIHIVPAYVNLDTVHGYPMAAAPWNARMEETTPRYLDAVHPTEGGYRQLGDAIYAWMKRLVAE